MVGNQPDLGTSAHLCPSFCASHVVCSAPECTQTVGKPVVDENHGIMESQKGLGWKGPLPSLRTWRGAENQGGSCSPLLPMARTEGPCWGWGLSQHQQLTGSFDGPRRWEEGEEQVGKSPWSGAPAQLPQVWLCHCCRQAEWGKCHLGSHLKRVLQAVGFYYKQPGAGVIPAWLRGAGQGWECTKLSLGGHPEQSRSAPEPARHNIRVPSWKLCCGRSIPEGRRA